MAYGLKYKAGWSSQSGVQGWLYIDEQDWEGAETTIKLRRGFEDALKIEYQFKGWENPIIGLTLGFTIINDLPDFYTLLPLMTAEERQYQVRVEVITPSASARSLFQGFLNVDSSSQRMLHKQDISFVASVYLSKLEHFNTSMVETIQDVYYINLIDSILSSIGSYNIRINSSFQDDTSSYAGAKSLFNVNGINTEAFWKDNVGRDNNLEILEKILNTFNAYIYWKDGYWYIEAFEDIWTETPSYIEYVTGQTYDEDDVGTLVNLNKSIEDIQDLQFVEASQTLHTDPGFKRIILTLPDNYLLLNLTVAMPLLADLPDVEAPFLSFPEPPMRSWEKYPPFSQSEWADGTWGSIRNGIKKVNSLGAGLTIFPQDKYQGLHTTFRLQITSEETNLSLRWRQAASTVLGKNMPFTLMEDAEVGPTEINWSLRYTDSPRYLLWSESAQAYEWVDGLTEATGFNTNEIALSSWDQDNGVVDFIKTLNLGQITALGIVELVLCIGSFSLAGGGTAAYMGAQYVGDVELSVNDELENNEIEAVSDSNFLNKKDIDLDLIDVANINYTNGVLRDGLTVRTTEWYYAASPSILNKITNWYIIQKFQLYNASKQRIFGSAKSATELAILSLFIDSNQEDKKFILMGTIYYPTEDIWGLKLYEFDNTTEVVLT